MRFIALGDICYIINVGDSRAVMSAEGGKTVELTKDHKPTDDDETERITKGGGKIYQ